MCMKILVINGPNINLLGQRQPDVYGKGSYEHLLESLKAYGHSNGVEFTFFQSQCEGEIVSAVHSGMDYDGIIINPAAYSHYSIAILDALNAVNTVKVEVHISQVHQREDFRKVLVTSAGCDATLSGMGFLGYALAADYIRHKTESR